ncbi:MAG: hypothetical protein FJ290_09440 [Planctomycetes bacterium]|nr:hypothetical protein [Planctomycetota bacterium]
MAATALALLAGLARADRSAAQGAPGYVLEKAGKHAEAALYYQRSLRGFREVWFQFWYSGDMSKAHPVARQLLDEYQARLAECLERAKADAALRARMEWLNEVWMAEYVDQELGGYKLSFAPRAEEAEKHGDFLLAEKLRQAAADYCRLVAAPYHERLAARLEGRQQRDEAGLHRKAAEDYQRQAAAHEALSRGDKLLARIPGLQGPAAPPDPRLLAGHYFKVYVAYHQRVLAVKGDAWLTGRTPEHVAAALTQSGLKHADESARLASTVVLANLGAKEALLAALADPSPSVRQAAATTLAGIRWADGWSACHRHADASVREAVQPLLAPAGTHVLSRTAVVVELLRGLEGGSAETRAFCQAALERITGEKRASAAAWREWWKGLGDPAPGLVRTGPDGAAVVDDAVDFGAWWQSGERSLQGRPNPLMAYPETGKVQWRGSLVVTRAGEYRFYVRNHGEQSPQAYNWKLGGDAGVIHFTTPSARLLVNGSPVLPNALDAIEDAKVNMRIDCSRPIKLEPGLHPLVLELDLKCARGGMWKGPSARLYWSSGHFLRQLVPADHLVHVQRASP